jgi:predicted nucleic acid-binding protein
LNRVFAKLQFCKNFLCKKQNAEHFARLLEKPTGFRKKPNYVLDACALIAMFNLEAGAATVRDLFLQVAAGKAAVYISPVNLLEVYYDRIQIVGAERAKEILRWIYASVVQIPENVTATVILEAGRLKSTYKISLADSIGLATAASVNGTFVTSDHHELDVVEHREQIPLLWIR